MSRQCAQGSNGPTQVFSSRVCRRKTNFQVRIEEIDPDRVDGVLRCSSRCSHNDTLWWGEVRATGEGGPMQASRSAQIR